MISRGTSSASSDLYRVVMDKDEGLHTIPSTLSALQAVEQAYADIVNGVNVFDNDAVSFASTPHFWDTEDEKDDLATLEAVTVY